MVVPLFLSVLGPCVFTRDWDTAVSLPWDRKQANLARVSTVASLVISEHVVQ